MSERSGGREQSEQSGASERVSGASERANGRASGPVLQSVFMAVIDHSDGRKVEVVTTMSEGSGLGGEVTVRKSAVGLRVSHIKAKDIHRDSIWRLYCPSLSLS